MMNSHHGKSQKLSSQHVQLYKKLSCLTDQETDG